MVVWQQQTQREERLKDLHKDGGRIGVIAEEGGWRQQNDSVYMGDLPGQVFWKVDAIYLVDEI
jgi:hypothetical protein